MLVDYVHFLRKYINFRLKSKPRGGHGIHSPFVYDLYTNCIDTTLNKALFEKIETLRKELLKNVTPIPISDFGAKEKNTDSSTTTVSKVVKTTSVPTWKGELLFILVEYFKPRSILELGTSIGFSTMYLALANLNTRITSIEGDVNTAKLAQDNFNKLGLSNVTLINGDFDKELPIILSQQNEVELVFIDGNHSQEATLRYFNLFSEKASINTLIILDDIRWSLGMENAWNTICRDKNVSTTIDLFDCGLVFFKKGIAKQNFKLRYGPF